MRLLSRELGGIAAYSILAAVPIQQQQAWEERGADAGAVESSTHGDPPNGLQSHTGRPRPVAGHSIREMP